MLIWANTAWAQEREAIQYPYHCIHKSVKTLTRNIDFPLQCISADFAYADFDSLANFSNAVFHDNADFTDARFDAAARLGLARFDSAAVFHETRFAQEANFLGTTFSNTVSFSSAEFKGFTIFLRTQFDSLAVFNHVEFGSYTSFEEAIFSGRADFKNASSEGSVSFQNTLLPDSLDFRELRTRERIDLTLAQLDTLKAVDPEYRSLIALEGADISKIKMNMELFRLWFPGLEDEPEKKIALYEEVLRKFEADDLVSSYKVLDIEYRSFKNTSQGRHVAHIVNKYGWNYGYNRAWIAWWSLGLLGGLAVVITFLYKPLKRVINQGKTL